MNSWLICTIAPGQFSSEYVAYGKQANGTEFSIFAPATDVIVEDAPSWDAPAGGKLRVEVWEKKGGQLLVRLPRQMSDGGQFITVKADQVENVSDPVSA